jgi:hypothetical protein
MKSLLLKAAVIASVAISLLISCGPHARAGTVGVEQFNLIDRVQQDLTFVEDGRWYPTCWCGPFLGTVPPPETIIHGNTPPEAEWFVGTDSGAYLHWFVTYGVQIPIEPSKFSQYCTIGADTYNGDNYTENVEGFCWTVAGQDCATCDVVSFLDWYAYNGGEGGLFEISAPTLAAVAEPPSAAMLVAGLIGLAGLGWARRRRFLHFLRKELTRGARLFGVGRAVRKGAWPSPA